MVAPRFIKIFSITVLVAFLASSVESQEKSKCPPLAKEIDAGKTKRVIVMLDSEAAAKNHYEMMEECYGKRVERVAVNVKKSSSRSKSKGAIRDFSVKGSSIHGYSAQFPTSFVKQLSKMKGVKMVELDAEVKIQYAIPQNLSRRAEDNDPEPNDDRIDQAKRPTNGKFIFPDSAGEGTNIFIVDTGIRTTHNEFENRAKDGATFCDTCDENEEDENGHGTHVASIAAGKTLGVARKANLIAVRVLDAKGSGSNSQVIEGLSFVRDQHENGDNKNSVVNMSLGGGFSAAVNSAVKDLTDAGVHVVVAAGNESEDACKSSPASEPTAITVGATQEDNEEVAGFSNFGKCLDIYAPGSNIKGAGFQNDNAVAVFSGTSQACPHVAGTVALLIAKDGNKSPAAMATELTDLSTKGVVKGLKDGSPDRFLRTPEA